MPVMIKTSFIAEDFTRGDYNIVRILAYFIASLLCLFQNANAETPSIFEGYGILPEPLSFLGEERRTFAEGDIPHALSLFKKNCGYKLGESLEQSIDSIYMSKFTNQYLFNFSMKIKLLKNKSSAYLSLFCEIPINDNSDTYLTSDLRSPKVIIERVDSSGRYYSNVKWERAFNATNWKGRIAYVNSIFGDGQKTPTLELVVCPVMLNLYCIKFFLTDERQYKTSEVNAVVRLLETITYVPDAER
jgi:hypothetical protein